MSGSHRSLTWPCQSGEGTEGVLAPLRSKLDCGAVKGLMCFFELIRILQLKGKKKNNFGFSIVICHGIFPPCTFNPSSESNVHTGEGIV